MVSAGLRTPDSGTPRARDDGMPGPADWVCRCLRGSGRDPARFLDALDRARNRAAQRAAGRKYSQGVHWLLTPTIEMLAQDRWEGSPDELIGSLPPHLRDGLTATSIGKQLAMNEAALLEAGVEYENKHTKRGAWYKFWLNQSGRGADTTGGTAADPAGQAPAA